MKKTIFVLTLIFLLIPSICMAGYEINPATGFLDKTEGSTIEGGDTVWLTDSNILYTTYDVGIGTSSPDAEFENTGDTILGGSLSVDTSTLVIDPDNDRVGIGIATPTSRLDLRSSGGDTTPFRITRTGGNTLVSVSETAGNDGILDVRDTSSITQVRLNSDGDSYFIGGALGIGTSTPSGDFNISSTNPAIALTDETTGHDNYLITSDGDILFIKNTSSGTDGSFVFRDNSNNDLLTVLETGDVGIGTNTPDEILTIDAGAGADAVIHFEEAGADKAKITYDGSTTDGLRFVTASYASPMTLDASVLNFQTASSGSSTFGGNVGIGLAGTSYRLEVKSAGASTNPLVVQSSLDTDALFSVRQNSGGDGEICILDDEANEVIKFRADADSYVTGGDFGIGTDSPTHRVHIVGDSANGVSLFANTQRTDGNANASQFEATASNSGHNRAVYASASNAGAGNAYSFYGVGGYLYNADSIGIGTTSPDFNLEVEDASDPMIAVHDTTNGVKTRMWSGNSAGYFDTNSAHPLQIRTNNTPAIYVDLSQNVGIGSAIPSAKLDVDGDGKVSDDFTIEGVLYADGNTIDLSDVTDEYVLAFDTATQKWRGVAQSGGGVSDGDKGDIVISGSGTVYSIDDEVLDSSMYVDGSIDHEHLSADVINGMTEVTSADSDYLMLWDATDSALKKCDAGEFRAAVGGGDAWSDAVDSDIIPDTDDTYDLGSAAVQFTDGFFDGTLEADAITLNGTALGSLYEAADAAIAKTDEAETLSANWNLGTPTATTPAENDNDTSVATTAYVQTEISAFIDDIVDDTTPELGGNLDVLNRTISSSTGNVIIDDYLVINNDLTVNKVYYSELENTDSGGFSFNADTAISGELSVNDVVMNEDLWEFNILSPSAVNEVTDPIYVGCNTKGKSVTVTEIKMWAVGYDDTACTVLEKDADGTSNSTTVDAINCTTGSDPYTDTETSITAATIEADHTIWIQLDDTDEPEQLAGYIKYEW